MKKVVLFSMALFLLSGCAQALGLGENKGYCEENGANLRDAGVCWSPWAILHNRDEANKRAYQGDSKCR